MRHIIKGPAASSLVRKHESPPQTEEEAARAWGHFRSWKKQETKSRCLGEQYYLCGYSEVDLSAEALARGQEIGMHLEHVEPKSKNPQRTFDHTNLIVSGIDDSKTRKLVKEDVFGGHAKLKWYDDNLFISPLHVDCSRYFHYESTGKVIPKINLSAPEKEQAQTTIDKLNLNAPVLVNWRSVWLKELEFEMSKLLDDSGALRLFAQTELLPINGRLRPFHSAQRQMFDAFGEAVIQESGQLSCS